MVSPNQAPEDSEVSSYKLHTASNTLKRSQFLKEAFRKHLWMRNTILTIAILGTSMVIGDGVLTPSISVLSAIQGIKVQKPDLSQDIVVIITIVILIGLFSIQRYGTDTVGYIFSPVVLVWLVSIALIGIYNIIEKDRSVFRAFNPYHMYDYLARNKKEGWISLGGLVLCVTDKVFWPMFVVATFAAIIASQAMISATFSIVTQAMTLGCFPRVKVVHTSKKYVGQIYIPDLNWLMMVLCIIIAAGFRDTTQIGNAYGVAVVSVFFVTTNLTTLIAIMIWQVPLYFALPAYVVIGSVELLYFSSIMYKVPKGGWVPLVFVAIFFSIMYTWNYGRRMKYDYEVKNKVSLDWVLGLGSNLGVQRVPGIGLVYTELAQGVPTIFPHLISNLPAMHSILVLVCVKNLPVPNVLDEERFLIRRIGPKQFRMFRCAVRFGYRDVQERKTHHFEQHLIQNLANFIMTEVINPPDLTVALGQDVPDLQKGLLAAEELEGSIRASNIMRSARRISRDVDDEGEESASESDSLVVPDLASKSPRKIDAGVEEEIEFIDSSRHAGVVYLLGQTEIRARKSSSKFRRFLINHYYSALKRNCRKSTLALNIPHERLLQVGMIHYI
ncbi:hypothetical protein Mapa_007297 [Marchantia paleacea]|nr:hypothetical protein Mapa_007297 [Marchantia paleacea]